MGYRGFLTYLLNPLDPPSEHTPKKKTSESGHVSRSFEGAPSCGQGELRPASGFLISGLGVGVLAS